MTNVLMPETEQHSFYPIDITFANALVGRCDRYTSTRTASFYVSYSSFHSAGV